MPLLKRLVPILFSLLFLSACTGSDTPEVPKWVSSPPEATDTEIYGVSVAKSRPEALVSAADGIASSLYTTAETLLPHYRLDTRQTARTKKALKRTLASLDYSRLTVVEERPMKKDIALLVSVRRADLLDQVEKRLDLLDDRLENEITAAQTQPPFVRLAVLGKAHEAHPALLADIVLLQTLDPLANLKPWLERIREREDAYSRIKFNAAVNVISDAGAIRYVGTFKKAFVAEGIRADGGLSSHDVAASVLLLADSQREHLADGYHLTVRLRVKTKVAGKTFKITEHFFKAVSKRGYGPAQETTVRQLRDKIREAGLFHFLGF